MSPRTVLATILFAMTSSAALAGSAAVSQDLRQRAQEICAADATRLCADSLASDDQIVACMKGKRPELTVPCRNVYDEVARALK